ncbi:hypothetical protein Hamer_G003626 [Homarus americanus]|uniref:Uncharacterized protein n=1 Tax=Homarus americanus TaxID=6706 RepID=A0A8J5K3V3_HOMAM|nr:hypothetical protein Hamer_G003626 [Homarus americanus]
MTVLFSDDEWVVWGSQTLRLQILLTSLILTMSSSVDDFLMLTATEENKEKEDDFVLEVNEIMLKQMDEFFKSAVEHAQHAVDMDHSLERSHYFSHGLQPTCAPYKQLYSQNNMLQNTPLLPSSSGLCQPLQFHTPCQ